MIKRTVRKILGTLGNLTQSEENKQTLSSINNSIIDLNYLQVKQSDPRYSDDKRLLKYGYQVLAQTDEDGIIAEIFNRIGLTNRFFVEFGVGEGIENNTAALLFQNWQGLWIEGEPNCATSLRENLKKFITSGNLKVQESFVTEENIEKILTNQQVPNDLDLLSIDIDSFDYYVWQSITNFHPRVIVIEYNASWGPTIEWVMPRDITPSFTDHTSCFGASLKSFEKLGETNGYVLVGCNITGVNAFSVRKDLVKDMFSQPFTSENHYEPPRYNLNRRVGHPRSFNIFS